METKNKKLKYSALAGLIIVVALFGAYLFQNLGVRTSLEGQLGEIKSQKKSIQRSQIAGFMKQLGPVKTYSLLKELYADNQNEGHNILHIFGEELYKSQKEVGITVCDFTFAYGCYHGFSTEALIEKGIEIMPKLEKECLARASSQPLACSHGLGHGALEYFGRENINKALESCGKLRWKGRLYGCQDGVFMEYNFPNILKESNKERSRAIDESLPYEPCGSAPDRYKNACYYSLSQWWSFEDRTGYRKIGELCNNIDNYMWRRSCFLGAGNDASADAGHNPSIAAKFCDMMPTLEGEAVCRAAVYVDVFGRETSLKEAQIACSGLSDTWQKSCEDHSIVSELSDI